MKRKIARKPRRRGQSAAFLRELRRQYGLGEYKNGRTQRRAKRGYVRKFGKLIKKSTLAKRKKYCPPGDPECITHGRVETCDLTKPGNWVKCFC